MKKGSDGHLRRILLKLLLRLQPEKRSALLTQASSLLSSFSARISSFAYGRDSIQ